MTKVWVVMDQLAVDDDGDDDVDVAAVHASEAGAQANLTPDGTCGGKSGARMRYIVPLELLP